jgi:hypothetical protein
METHRVYWFVSREKKSLVVGDPNDWLVGRFANQWQLSYWNELDEIIRKDGRSRLQVGGLRSRAFIRDGQAGIRGDVRTAGTQVVDGR